MISITAILCMIFMTVFGQEQPIDLPVTFYLKELEAAQTTSALYYYSSLCAKGVNNRKQAILQIFLSNNPEWNLQSKGYAVVQVSVCQDSFTESCVIATNYKYGINTVAVSNISWTVGTETAYYIRLMGQLFEADFSMELSFLNTTNTTSFPWVSDAPFSGSVMSNPNPLLQYWKAEGQYSVMNGGRQSFALAYCDQGQVINGIDVSLSTLADPSDYSLIEQWACAQTTPVADCTFSNYDWYNPRVASFNLLQCDNQVTTTAGGIYVIVTGDGANTDLSNTFYLYASEYM